MARIPQLSLEDNGRLWSDRVSRGLSFRWKKTEKKWNDNIKLLLGDQWIWPTLNTTK